MCTPADPAHMAQAVAYKIRKQAGKQKKKEGTGAMRASDQLTADDYITPYIDDDDSDAEEGS